MCIRDRWWCAALAARGVAVPSALISNAGKLLETLRDGRTASVIDWVEGEALGEAGVPFAPPEAVLVQRHQALGRLLAHLHAETDRLDLPADFTRPRWDIEGLVGEAPLWGRFWDHPAATPAQAETLRRARAHLREMCIRDRLKGLKADSEGLALAPDGSIYISFEGSARVLHYPRIGGSAENLPSHPDFRHMQLNSSLESVAIGPDGTIYTLPERTGDTNAPYPVYRLRGGKWDKDCLLYTSRCV